MNIVAILLHITAFVQLGKDVDSIVKNIFVAHSEKFPSKDEGVKLVDDLLALCASGVLNLPDAVLSKVNEVLNALKVAVSAL